MASSNDDVRVEQSVRDQLSTEEIERHVLATVRDIGVETITWSGGEFILRSDAVDLVRMASEYGYSSIIATNGTRMDRETLLELSKASDGSLVVAVGINSIDAENAQTRDADCDVALEVLDLCEELDIRRNVVVTVGQHNMATLDTTLDWLEEKGIPYNRSPFTARGSGREYWDRLRFTRQDMEDVIHPALRKHPLGYISYTPFFLAPEVHDRFSQGAKNVTVPQNPSIGCWCGTWLALSAEGDVSPCAILLDDVVCGNVREQLRGKCGRCRYKFTCGGCRAMAYYESGDVMAEDPTCFFEPENEGTVSEHEAETNKMFKRYAFMVRYAHSKRSLIQGDDQRVAEVDEEDGPFDQKGRA
jgi:radical SAM protein with 4Fe4S-binding SPASM domain